MLDWSACFQRDYFALGSAVFGNAAGIHFHRQIAAHAVKLAVGFAVFMHDLAARFIVSGEHATEHDEVRSATERFGYVAGYSAAAVAADEAAEAVCGVGAFDDGGELRIADASHLARGADAAGTDAYFDDVGAGEDQRFGDVSGDDVSGHDRGLGISLAKAFDEVDESFGVAIGHINAHEFNGVASGVLDHPEFLDVGGRDAERIESVLMHRVVVVVEKGDVIFNEIMLMQRDVHVMFCQRCRHFEGAYRVHVGSDDRHRLRVTTGVAIGVAALQFHLRPRAERGAFGAKQDVFKIQFEFFFDAHGDTLFVGWAPSAHRSAENEPSSFRAVRVGTGCPSYKFACTTTIRRRKKTECRQTCVR